MSGVWDTPSGDSGGDAGGEAAAEGAEVEAVDVDTGEEVTENLDAQEGEDVDANVLDAESDDAEGEAEPEIHTVKVDGEEFEVDLDELKAGYSRGRAATKRFQAASKLQGEIQGFVGHLKSGDPQVISDLFGRLGIDFTDIAEKHLSTYLEDMQRPEHERGMRKLERERAAFQREQETLQQRQQEARIEEASQREVERYQTEMTSELESAGLPTSGPMIGKVARELEMSLKHGYEMSVKEAVAIVNEETRALIRKLDPAAARRLLGADAADDIRRQEAASASANQKRKASKVASRGRQPGGRPSGRQAPARVNPEDMNGLKALFDS